VRDVLDDERAPVEDRRVPAHRAHQRREASLAGHGAGRREAGADRVEAPEGDGRPRTEEAQRGRPPSGRHLDEQGVREGHVEHRVLRHGGGEQVERHGR
jgi:hypothetical protein